MLDEARFLLRLAFLPNELVVDGFAPDGVGEGLGDLIYFIEHRSPVAKLETHSL